MMTRNQYRRLNDDIRHDQWQPFIEQQAQEGPDDPAPQQGQQQQQQQQAPPDPFATINLDNLDETTRAQVELARAEFATVANQRTTLQQQAEQATRQAQQYQAQYDRLVHERGSQPGQQQQQQPPDMEEELVQAYIKEHNVPPEQAKNAAKMMKTVLGVFEKRFSGQLAGQLAPFAQSTAMNSAHSAFQEAMSQDRTGLFQNPQIAQHVWERVQQLAQQGQPIETDFVRNLGRIAAMDAYEKGTFQFGGQQQQQQSPTIMPNMQIPHLQVQQPQLSPQFQQPLVPNMQTRWTFPGAGGAPIVPHQHAQQQQRGQFGGLPVMDADLAAAMTQVVGKWETKPVEYQRTFLPHTIPNGNGGARR